HGVVRLRRTERAVEAEEPHAVASRGARKEVPGRVRDDVLAPFVLEHGCRCVHAGARLELPELRAVARIERRQAAVVAADEYEPAAGRDGAAVARLRPVLL